MSPPDITPPLHSIHPSSLAMQPDFSPTFPCSSPCPNPKWCAPPLVSAVLRTYPDLLVAFLPKDDSFFHLCLASVTAHLWTLAHAPLSPCSVRPLPCTVASVWAPWGSSWSFFSSQSTLLRGAPLPPWIHHWTKVWPRSSPVLSPYTGQV